MSILLGIGIFVVGAFFGLAIGALCNIASHNDDYERRDL